MTKKREKIQSRHQIYKHLMNGVSHMLPFVVGGGILIAIAFLIDGFSVDLNSLPFRPEIKLRYDYLMAAMFKSIGWRGIRLHAPNPCRIYCDEYCRQTDCAVGFRRRCNAANEQAWILGVLVAGFPLQDML